MALALPTVATAVRVPPAGATEAVPSVVLMPGAKQPLMLDPNPHAPTSVAPAASSRLKSALASPATIQVQYTGFSAPAQAAFQQAVDLWAPLLSSPVPITVHASWTALGAGVLGQAGPGTFVRDQPGLPQANTWYPIALANSIAGTDLDPAGVDIEADFNSAFPTWYFGTNGQPGAGQVDFVSVVMHELGHGLGFLGFMDVAGGSGTSGQSGSPAAFDRFTTSNGTPLLSFASPSAALGTALQGSTLRFAGAAAVAANGGVGPRLYAPATWQPGSSYSHLDEATYPAGNPNSLMTPALGAAESIHDPGPVTLGILADTGWPQGALAQAPDTPVSVSAQALDAAASVAFALPAGSAPATSFTVTATPGGASASGAASPIVVGGLTNGVSYTFTVTATNDTGTSPASAPSSPVTPVALPSTVPTFTAPASGATVSGAVHVAATSGAFAVRFTSGGTALGAPIPTVAGQAELGWDSWGFANGATSIDAFDCATVDAASCSAVPASLSVVLTNDAPVVTAPTNNKLVSGSVLMSATAPGGGVAFLIDGVQAAFDGAAPFSTSTSIAALTDGTHRVRARACNSTGTVCMGPSSLSVKIQVKSLHPAIVSRAPSRFSPNHDGVKDSVVVTFSLPDRQSVSWRVLDSTGATKVFGAVSLGSLAAGSHQFVWTGTDTSGLRAPDGTYRISLSTRRNEAGVTLRGVAETTVVVDVSRPTLTDVTGDGATVFPSGGGAASFTAGATLSERATFTLIVRNASGALFNQSSTKKSAGTANATWNGHDPSGASAPSGTYNWWLRATDLAGNTRLTGVHTVKVVRLQARSASFNLNGDAAPEVLGSDVSCSFASEPASDFANGLWLLNECLTFEVLQAQFQVSLPSAYKYDTMTLSVHGFTSSPPSEIYGVIGHPASSFEVLNAAVAPSSPQWVNLGSHAASAYVHSRILDFAVGVDTNYGAPSDFDINVVHIDVTYFVKT